MSNERGLIHIADIVDITMLIQWCVSIVHYCCPMSNQHRINTSHYYTCTKSNQHSVDIAAVNLII